MTKNDILEELQDKGYNNDAKATQVDLYTTINRSQLFSETNRLNAGWARGKYVVASLDQSNHSLSEYLSQWKSKTQGYKDQILCFEVAKDDWHFFDYNGKEIEFNVALPDYRGGYKLQSTMDFPLQQIYYGAPGTGKSYRIKEIVKQYPKENIFRTTFHPDSDYSTFVGCYKPTKVKKPVRDMAGKTALDDKKDEIFEDAITYSFVPQAFLKAYIRAWNMLDSGQPVFLIIEEINRGNCAQIFGDLFQLLDRRQDGYSDYPIKADTDLAQYLSETDVDGNDILTNPKGIADGELCLPPNLYIWGTMNTSDQSLFPIDSAFKRRWNWKYIKISDAQLNWEIQDVKDENSWYAFIEQINKVIVQVTNSADKQLGYFFCQPDMPVDQDKKSTISLQRFVDKVVFYLWNDVFKDSTFGDTNLFADDNGNAISFPDFYDNIDKVNEPTTLAFIRRVMQWGKSPVELQQDSE